MLAVLLLAHDLRLIVKPVPPQSIIATIPARGGSNGMPRKNLKLLAGKPLLAHSILNAKRTPGIKQVTVSVEEPQLGLCFA